MNPHVTVIDAPQRSEPWFAARCGRLTGSRAADILATIKTGEAAARRDLRIQLIVERITGRTQDDHGFVTDIMQRGIDLEPQARAAYEALTGSIAVQTGFLSHTALMVGCSLDGSVNDFEGILELKCPKSATHLRYLRERTLPKEHLAQVTHNLWVSGAQWCDFLSYDDRFPAELQVFLVRVHATDLDLDGYARQADAFLAEVEAEIADVHRLRHQEAR